MPELLGGRGRRALSLEVREAVWELAETYFDEHIVSSPLAQGLLGWAYDPTSVASAVQPTRGVEYMVRVIPAKTARCANGHISLSSGGTTLTSGQCFLGLRNAAGDLLAKSATVHSTWESSGHKKIAWTTPVDVVAGVPLWVCWVHNGAAAMTVLRSGSSDIHSVGCLPGQGRIQSLGTSITDLAASVTMTSASVTGEHAFWAAIS